MAYLIEHLLPGLALAVVLGAVAGWQLHEAQTRATLAALTRQREDALAELLRFADPAKARQAVEAAEERAARAEAERAEAIARAGDVDQVRARLAATESFLREAETDLDQARVAYDAAIAREREGRTQDQNRFTESLVSEVNAAQAELAAARAEVTRLQAELDAARVEKSAAAPPTEAVDWRAHYMAARIRYLEGRLPAARAAQARLADLEPLAAQAPELSARIAELEQRLASAPAAADEEARVRLVWRNRYLEARVRRLESDLIQGEPAPKDTLAARKDYWRLAYFVARAKHLEESAKESAARERLALEDAAFAAEMRAFAAERDLAIAQDRPVPVAPEHFRYGARLWTTQAAGPAETSPDAGGWRFLRQEGGAVARTEGAFRELRPKTLVRLAPGRRYRVTARVRQVTDAPNGGGQWAGIDGFPGLREDGAPLPAEATPSMVDGPNGPRTRALRASDGWVTLSAEFEQGASPAAFVRPRVYVNWRGDAASSGDGAVELSQFLIEDVSPPVDKPAASTPPPAQVEAGAIAEDESARLRAAWRSRYLAARVERLEELLMAEKLTAERDRATLLQELDSQRAAFALELQASREASLSDAKAAAPAEPALPAPPPPPQPPPPPPAIPPAPALRPRTLAAPLGGIPDDLRMIDGVTPQLERSLNAVGIYHFAQIASWTPANVAWVDRYLSLRGRIEREAWVEKAATLAAAARLDAPAV